MKKLNHALLICLMAMMTLSCLTTMKQVSGLAPSEKGDYVIITTNAIVANSKELAAFMNLKASEGYKVRLVTENNYEILTGQYPNERADKIRAWLMMMYGGVPSWFPQYVPYVLLIGDPTPWDSISGSFDPKNIGLNKNIVDTYMATWVPMKIFWPSYPALSSPTGDDWSCPTDLYYSDLTHNFDQNGDGFYGVDGSAGVENVRIQAMSISIDAYVGRIPVYYTTAQGDYAPLDKILLKTINYETPVGDISWRFKVLLPAYPLWPDEPGWNLMNYIRNYGMQETTPNLYSYYRVFSNVNDTDSGRAPRVEENCEAGVGGAILADWQSGYGMVTWETHGTPWSAAQVFNADLCPQLDDSKPSFVFASSCLNADPDIHWPPYSFSLAYSLLVNGAICVVGATRNSKADAGWPADENFAGGSAQDFAFHFTLQILKGANSGYALGYTRIVTGLDGHGTWVNHLVFNLYGDPDASLIPGAGLLHVPPNIHIKYPSDPQYIHPIRVYSRVPPHPSPGPLEPTWQELTLQFPVSLLGNYAFSGNFTLPDFGNLDLDSITLNGVVPIDPSWLVYGNETVDGMVALTVRFNYASLAEFLLGRNRNGGNITLTLMGNLLDGTEFAEEILLCYRNAGDQNMDGKIDIKDVASAAKSFGTVGPDFFYKGSSPSPSWTPLADENGDNRIDIRDIAQVASNFGVTIPQILVENDG